MPDTEDGERPKRRGTRRYLIVLLGLLAVVGVLVALKFAQIRSLIGFGTQMAAQGPPPEAVSTDVARGTVWETTVATVGSVAGVQSVAVSNDAPGIVEKIGFESGAVVKRGRVLVELDAKPEQANLAAAKAQRDNAELTAKRSRALVKKGALAGAVLDEDETRLRAATAEVAALEAQIERKKIRAPFDGRLGIRAVNVGQYLSPGTTVTTLDSVEGAYVDFTLPQERGGTVRVGMPVRITLQGTPDPVDGSITAIDPTVDPTSRTLRLRASVAASDVTLRPGMFVNVAVVLPERAQVVSVPATAIVHASYGDSVFVVEPRPADAPGSATTPDGKPVKLARQQFVRVGASRGDFVAIEGGIRAGQEVVSAGAFKLRSGSPIVVDNRVKPTALLDPHPENR